ncbi:antA/AntB antirepressor family protein [Acidithiobacillus sp. MC6.1]|nr:antA/AntB antirepressor family protein [Acidithiobacillus sp. MC6.1]
MYGQKIVVMKQEFNHILVDAVSAGDIHALLGIEQKDHKYLVEWIREHIKRLRLVAKLDFAVHYASPYREENEIYPNRACKDCVIDYFLGIVPMLKVLAEEQHPLCQAIASELFALKNQAAGAAAPLDHEPLQHQPEKPVQPRKPMQPIQPESSGGLIPVGWSEIDNAVTQTVNARELHAFLEVGKKFSDWIKDRIDQYNFVIDHDFISFSLHGEKPQGGRPALEYHLTLDMAKEISMVERNAKGKEARQYFITCERIAKGIVRAVASPQPTRNGPETSPDALPVERLKAIHTRARSLEQLCKIFGMRNRKQIAQVLVQRIAIDEGIDIDQYLPGLDSGQPAEKVHTPTALSQEIGGVTAHKINLALATLGLQTKATEGSMAWTPTEEGLRYAVLEPAMNQIVWREPVLPVLRAHFGELRLF